MSPKLNDQLKTYVAPALLIAIACLQFYLVQTQGLTPWKGGGFGMFSTVDSGGARFLRIYLTSQDQETAVPLPRSDAYSRLEDEIQRFPRQRLLNQLTAKLATETWVPDNHNPFNTEPTTEDNLDQPTYRAAYEGEPVNQPDKIPVEAIRVEVWRYRFDSQTGMLQAQKWLESTYATLEEN